MADKFSVLQKLCSAGGLEEGYKTTFSGLQLYVLKVHGH